MHFWLFLTAIGSFVWGECGDEISVYTAYGQGEATPCGSSPGEWCFEASEGTSPVVTLEFPEKQVLRGVEFEGVGNFKMRAENGVWYRSLNEPGNFWSLLNATVGNIALDRDFAASELQIFPIIPGNSGRATLRLFGCPERLTRTAEFRFNSSVRAITGRFQTVGNFASDFVARLSRATTIPTDAFLVGEISESGESEISVPLRVFASGEFSAARVRVMIEPETSEAVARFVQTTQFWIRDLEPMICAGKICEAGSFCLAGVCVDHAGLEIGKASEKPSPESVLVAPKLSSEPDVVAAISDHRYVVFGFICLGLLSFAYFQWWIRGNKSSSSA